jgi:hypothetical protein
VSPLSTDDKVKCGGRLGIRAKQSEVVRGGAKSLRSVSKKFVDARWR